MAAKVISHKAFPVRLPISFTLSSVACLKLFGAPDWLWGAFIALMGLVFLVVIWARWQQHEVDIDVSKLPLKNQE